MTRNFLREKAEREIKSIKNDKSLSKEGKQYLAEKVWENYNDEVRKRNKGE